MMIIAGAAPHPASEEREGPARNAWEGQGHCLRGPDWPPGPVRGRGLRRSAFLLSLPGGKGGQVAHPNLP
jgi:hypothetical protein